MTNIIDILFAIIGLASLGGFLWIGWIAMTTDFSKCTKCGSPMDESIGFTPQCSNPNCRRKAW